MMEIRHYALVLGLALASGCSQEAEEPQVVERCPEPPSQTEEETKIEQLCMDLDEDMKGRRHQALLKFNDEECLSRQRVKKDVGYGDLWVRKYESCEPRIALERDCTSRTEYVLTELNVEGEKLDTVIETSWNGFDPVKMEWHAKASQPARENPIVKEVVKVERKYIRAKPKKRAIRKEGIDDCKTVIDCMLRYRNNRR